MLLKSATCSLNSVLVVPASCSLAVTMVSVQATARTTTEPGQSDSNLTSLLRAPSSLPLAEPSVSTQKSLSHSLEVDSPTTSLAPGKFLSYFT